MKKIRLSKCAAILLVLCLMISPVFATKAQADEASTSGVVSTGAASSGSSQEAAPSSSSQEATASSSSQEAAPSSSSQEATASSSSQEAAPSSSSQATSSSSKEASSEKKKAKSGTIAEEIRFLANHTGFHFGLPELIVGILMLGVLVLTFSKSRKVKKRHEELEDMLEQIQNPSQAGEASDNAEA